MIRINLAPVETRRRRSGFKIPMPSPNLAWLFGVLYILAALGVTYHWWGLNRTEAKLASDLDRGNKELQSLKTTLGQGANVRAQLTDIQKRVQLIEELMKGQARSIVMLDAFADVVPRDLWITSMEEKGDVLKLNGTAYSTTAVSDLMTNLRSSGKFKEIDLVVSRQDLAKTPSVVTFEVTCRFES
jgi:Tfp pilus assembly protein PilN